MIDYDRPIIIFCQPALHYPIPNSFKFRSIKFHPKVILHHGCDNCFQSISTNNYDSYGMKILQLIIG